FGDDSLKKILLILFHPDPKDIRDKVIRMIKATMDFLMSYLAQSMKGEGINQPHPWRISEHQNPALSLTAASETNLASLAQAEKLPTDGSEGLIHDFSRFVVLVLTSTPIFMVCKKQSEGSRKLSQRTLPLELSFKIKFPVSKSCAVEFLTAGEIFDDHILLFCEFKITRFPSSDIVTLPLESCKGLSLLATHTTVGGWTLNITPT
uniref:Uncharacterized protein n=1 Tax=Solanum lycopersicum TaxID=4081 RepID=A0A3Q7F574_SOLLC